MVISSHQVLRGCVETDAVRSYQATSNIADLIIATPPQLTHTPVFVLKVWDPAWIFLLNVSEIKTLQLSHKHIITEIARSPGVSSDEQQNDNALRRWGREFRAEQMVYKSACAAWPWIVLHINQLNSIITAQHLRDPEKKVATYNIQSILSSLPPPCETTCLQY